MARYSGIYLHLEGDTSTLDSLQQPRETAWDTTSGLFRYMDTASGIHYFASSGFWIESGSGVYYADNQDVFIGNPSTSNPLRLTNMGGYQHGVFSSQQLLLCGAYLDLCTTSGFVARAFDNEFRMIKTLTFGDDSWGIPATVSLAASGDYFNFYHNGSYAGRCNLVASYWMGISGMYMTLETWSGDMLLLTKNGGNIILNSSGFSSDIILEATGDVYSQPWTDFTTSTPISGWSSLTASGISYKTIGKLVFVQYNISGMGDGGLTMFRVPYTNAGTTVRVVGTDYVTPQYFNTELGTGGISGVVYLRLGPNLVWNSGSLKAAAGQFWYERS